MIEVYKSKIAGLDIFNHNNYYSMLQTVKQAGLMISFQIVEYPFNQFVSQIYEVKGNPILGSQRIFPRNGVDITFNLGSSIYGRSAFAKNNLKVPDSFVMGNRSSYFDWNPENHVHISVIQFTYNGFFKLFNIGQNDFGDSIYSFDPIFPKHADFLHEKLLSKTTIQERFKLLNKWIEEVYQTKRDKGHYIVEYLIDKITSNHLVTIKDLVKESGFSRKHLFKCFKHETGLSPKQFQRISRFNSLLQNVSTDPNWSQLSFDLGFFDQSHLIREVKYFSGLSPKQLLKSSFHPIGKHVSIQNTQR